MPLIIKDTGDVPKERWQYYVEQTDFTVRAPNWPALYPEIEKHCKANGVPVPDPQAVVDWCCANLSIHCFHSESPREPLMNRWMQGLPSKIPEPCCNRK